MWRIGLLLLLLAPFAVATQAAEQGYRVEHPDGTVEFTDEPRSGGEPIVLEEVPTVEPPPEVPPRPRDRARSARPQLDYQVRITSPEPETTFQRNVMELVVQVATDPRLQGDRGHRVQIELDGETVASGSATRFRIGSTVRGSHQLLARVLDAEGRELGRSEAVTFHVRQNTRLITP